jgi:bifunctional UDP-N-acetylglucosamine pyrophosphorylase/glucosamine-1-phosphate N-acetyltransferase
MTLEVIVLAAGKGTRMRSALPKVMHDLAGRPLLDHVLETISSLSAQRIHVVCGHGGEIVRKHVGEPGWINWVAQVEQLGTGHAVQQALPQVADDAIVLWFTVMCRWCVHRPWVVCWHRRGTNRLALLTAQLPNPSGYGRIVRNEDSQVIGIVEERDCQR